MFEEVERWLLNDGIGGGGDTDLTIGNAYLSSQLVRDHCALSMLAEGSLPALPPLSLSLPPPHPNASSRRR